MNKQNSKKIFTAITLTILGMSLFLFMPTLAKATGLVEIQFEQQPLFKETNFLPGQEATHWVKVINHSPETQTIGVEVINHSSCSQDCLSDQLRLVISDDSLNKLYEDSLTDFFKAGEIKLSELGTEQEIKYYFSVTFLSGAGNTYKNSEVSFSFNIGAFGKESISGEITLGGGGGGGGVFIPGLEISNENASQQDGEINVIVAWLTNKLATSRVIYSLDSEPHTLQLDNPPNYGYLHSALEDPTLVTSHSVNVTGLEPGKTYYYRCISRGSFAISAEYSFTTLGPEETVENGGEEIVEEESPAGESPIGEITEETGAGGEIVKGGEAMVGKGGGAGGAGEGGKKEETAGGEEKPKEEENAGMNLSNLLAAIGNFFTLKNLGWLFLFLVIISTVLFVLSVRKKRERKNK